MVWRSSCGECRVVPREGRQMRAAWGARVHRWCAPAQWTSLLEPPRARLWLKLLVQNLATPGKRLYGAFFSCKPCFHLHTFVVEHFTPTFLGSSEASLEAPPMVYRAIAGMPLCRRMQMLNKQVRALPFSQRGVSAISARCIRTPLSRRVNKDEHGCRGAARVPGFRT